jgi:hypothetical protein
MEAAGLLHAFSAISFQEIWASYSCAEPRGPSRSWRFSPYKKTFVESEELINHMYGQKQ